MKVNKGGIGGTKMFRVLIPLLLSLVLISCSTTNKINKASTFLPRKGYLFVKKTVKLKKCIPEKCDTSKNKTCVKKKESCTKNEFKAVGSGFIVRIVHEGAYVMTAAHVCRVDRSNLLPSVTILKESMVVETLDGRNFKATVLEYNSDIDACLMFAENLVSSVQEVKLANEAPKEGDKVFNIASPYGIHYVDVVPIFEGRYVGKKNTRAFYTFPAAPGSSGSMILNHKGELIGLLHSVYYKMNTIIVSVTYTDLMNFIRGGIRKHEDNDHRYLKYIPNYSKYF